MPSINTARPHKFAEREQLISQNVFLQLQLRGSCNVAVNPLAMFVYADFFSALNFT